MAVTRKKKIILIIGILLLLGVVVGLSVTRSGRDVPTVEVETVKRRPLLEARVTANGEIRPLNFYELTSEVAGRVIEIYVREGDVVKKGQPLLKVDPTQIEANLSRDMAALRAAQAEKENAEVQLRAALNNISNVEAMLASARYDLERSKADFTLAQQDYERSQKLVEEEVISKAEFDAAESRFRAAQALVRAQESRVKQLEAQLREAKIRVEAARAAVRSADARIAQAQASLRATQDQFSKTIQKAPIDGVIASLPIRVGQYALTTFQTTPLLTIADMSEIRVEVQVDETDVTSVKPGQKAKIKVDALGDKELDGVVKEVGQAPITQGPGGLSSLSTTSQEAKDFKVVISLVNLTDEVRNALRPGMSATATITTDVRHNVIAIPVQAIVEREVPTSETSAAKTASTAAESEGKKEVQGVFVVEGNRARFRPVQTGIFGETDIEIVDGLKEGEVIVVGPYRELRNLKDNTIVKTEKSFTTR